MSDQANGQGGAGRRSRALTAGLSAVGGAAGVAGLAYAGRDVGAALRAGKKIPLRTKALLPLEAVGLGGEVASTKILGNDARQKQQQPTGVTKAMEFNSRAGVGRRIVEPKSAVSKDVGLDNPFIRSKGERKAVRRSKTAWGGYGANLAGLGVALHGLSRGRMKQAVGGLGIQTAGVGTTLYGAHRSANKWRESQGLRPRSALTGLPKEPASKGFISAKTRRKAEAKGEAMPGGRYPIRNSRDYHNALMDLQRTGASANSPQSKWVHSHDAEYGKAIGKAPATRLAALGRAKRGRAIHQEMTSLQDKAKGRLVPRDTGSMTPKAKPFEKAWKGEPGDKRNTKYAATAVGGTLIAPGLGTVAGPGVYAVYRSHPDAKWRKSVRDRKRAVRKARRSDSEADRQRRIGYVGGAATGGSIVTGGLASRHLEFGHGKGTVGEGRRLPKGTKYRSFSVTGTRRGAGLAGASAALAGLAYGAARHGVSERNKTWT